MIVQDFHRNLCPVFASGAQDANKSNVLKRIPGMNGAIGLGGSLFLRLGGKVAGADGNRLAGQPHLVFRVDQAKIQGRGGRAELDAAIAEHGRALFQRVFETIEELAAALAEVAASNSQARTALERFLL